MTDPSTDTAAVSETKVFLARTRVLLDLLLFVNVAIFIVCLLYSMDAFWAFALMASAGISLFWVAIVRPLSRIEMGPKTITGRTPWFQKITIQLRKVDLSRTNKPSNGFMRKFICKDIWSLDDECIRLYRRILGERQIIKIMTTVEKYPFRGSRID